MIPLIGMCLDIDDGRNSPRSRPLAVVTGRYSFWLRRYSKGSCYRCAPGECSNAHLLSHRERILRRTFREECQCGYCILRRVCPFSSRDLSSSPCFSPCRISSCSIRLLFVVVLIVERSSRRATTRAYCETPSRSVIRQMPGTAGSVHLGIAYESVPK